MPFIPAIAAGVAGAVGGGAMIAATAVPAISLGSIAAGIGSAITTVGGIASGVMGIKNILSGTPKATTTTSKVTTSTLQQGMELIASTLKETKQTAEMALATARTSGSAVPISSSSPSPVAFSVGSEIPTQWLVIGGVLIVILLIWSKSK